MSIILAIRSFHLEPDVTSCLDAIFLNLVRLCCIRFLSWTLRMSFNTDIKVKHIRVSKLNRRWAVKNKGKSMYIYTLILFGCLLRQAMIETMRKRVSVRESEKRGLNSILCPLLKVNRVHLSLSLLFTMSELFAMSLRCPIPCHLMWTAFHVFYSYLVGTFYFTCVSHPFAHLPSAFGPRCPNSHNWKSKKTLLGVFLLHLSFFLSFSSRWSIVKCAE